MPEVKDVLQSEKTVIHEPILQSTMIDTKLGSMLAIASEEALYLLEFVDRRGLDREIERLRSRTKSVIVPGSTPIIKLVELELKRYFAGKLSKFTIPLFLRGSDFQQSVWDALQSIPIGTICSYLNIAQAIGKPTACRAVANANGSNQLAIIIPCHRVINANGAIGGYAGGVSRKEWLVNFEQSI